MLKGACAILRNRYTYAILIDNDLISIEWKGDEIFSLPTTGLSKKYLRSNALTTFNNDPSKLEESGESHLRMSLRGLPIRGAQSRHSV